MPTVAFHDLLIHPRDHDLIAATHGRGMWILDDITALRKATDEVVKQDAAVFDVAKPGTRWLRISRGGYGRGDLFFKGENPPDGALINYFIKAKPEAPATLEIGDIAGPLKTTYILDDVQPGIGRVAWDLRFDPPAATTSTLVSNLKRTLEPALKRTDLTAEQMEVLKKAAADLDKWATNFRKVMEIQRTVFAIAQPGRGQFGGGGGGRGGMMGGGQMAEPGTYPVKLTVGDKTYAGKVSVRLDPMLTAK
jgi:hypothetical protein